MAHPDELRVSGELLLRCSYCVRLTILASHAAGSTSGRSTSVMLAVVTADLLPCNTCLFVHWDLSTTTENARGKPIVPGESLRKSSGEEKNFNDLRSYSFPSTDVSQDLNRMVVVADARSGEHRTRYRSVVVFGASHSP